ncbi:DUF1624 domain-containing protein [Puteibacter caeruleilacunae]|nr:DUF1624 domain-containing protein [Puteibacter caeruleilacunae]
MNLVSKIWRLFSIENTNNGRQLELDIARALAVIFMVLVHVQMILSNDAVADSDYGIFIDFMGGVPAAPVFMFLMGVGFLYTRNNNYQLFLKRGVKVLLLGYLLNFLRESLPELTDYLIEGDKDCLYGAIEGFIDVDILQFAGITMIFFGLLKKFKVSALAVAMIGMLLVLANTFPVKIETSNYFISAITGLFIGTSEFAEFPFLNWSCYPILGYLFAHLLVKCTDKKLFYRIVFIGSTIALVITLTVCLYFNIDLGMETELSYYHHNAFANVAYCLFVVSWISLLFMIIRFIPLFMLVHFKRWSKNVTEIYFIHWIIIGWMEWYLFPDTFSFYHLLAITVSIFAVSDLIAYHMGKRNIKLV